MKKIFIFMTGILLASMPLFAATSAPADDQPPVTVQTQSSLTESSEDPAFAPAEPVTSTAPVESTTSVAVTTTNFMDSNALSTVDSGSDMTGDITTSSLITTPNDVMTSSIIRRVSAQAPIMELADSTPSNAITVSVTESTENIQNVLNSVPVGTTVAITGEGIVQGTSLTVPAGKTLQCDPGVVFMMTEGFDVQGTLVGAVNMDAPLASSVTGTIVNSYSNIGGTLVPFQPLGDLNGGVISGSTAGGLIGTDDTDATGTIAMPGDTGLGGSVIVSGSGGTEADVMSGGGSIMMDGNGNTITVTSTQSGTIPVRPGMEPARDKFLDAAVHLQEMITFLERPTGSKQQEKEIWKSLDQMWVDIKNLLVDAKQIVRQAGDKELAKEISKFIPQMQSELHIAQQQSRKGKSHQPVLDFLLGFQNKLTNLQEKFYQQ